MEDESIKIDKLIEALLYEFIEAAYWLHRYKTNQFDGSVEEVEEALIKALVSIGPLQQHMKELGDLLYPRMQGWS